MRLWHARTYVQCTCAFFHNFFFPSLSFQCIYRLHIVETIVSYVVVLNVTCDVQRTVAIYSFQRIDFLHTNSHTKTNTQTPKYKYIFIYRSHDGNLWLQSLSIVGSILVALLNHSMPYLVTGMTYHTCFVSCRIARHATKNQFILFLFSMVSYRRRSSDIYANICLCRKNK